MLKSQKRVQRKVTEKGTISSNWKTFLRSSEIKDEPFPFLSQKAIEEFINYKRFIVAVSENVLCTRNIDLDNLIPCNIGEADKRMLVHVNTAKQFSRHLM